MRFLLSLLPLLLLLLLLLPLIAATQHNPHTAQEVIDLLHLQPNVERGFFRETFRDTRTVSGNRSASTAIYSLLEGSVGFSHWHRVDAVEVWHHYAGAPLTLESSWDNGTATERVLLGDDLFDGQLPQGVVPAHRWQRAKSVGAWTLAGTTVAPGFVEGGFEMREGWMPDDGCEIR